MKTLAIFVIALIAVSQATKTGTTMFLGFPLNFSQKRSIMTLLTQVEALMKNGGPLDTITKMLADFKDAIVNEQVAHDNLYEKQTIECADEKGFREKEISDATAAFKSAQETFDGCSSQQARAKADISISKGQLSEASNYQIVLEDTERQAREFYNLNVEQTKGLISALEEALVMLEEFFQGSASFVDITLHANKLLKGALVVKKAHLMAPVLSAFVQMSTKIDEFDEIMAKRVKTILNDLLNQFQDFLVKLVEDGNARVAKYEEEAARVAANIAQYKQDIDDLSFEIAELDKCIVNQTGIMSSAKAKVDRNQQLLNDADSLCASCVVEYEQATKARKAELKLLAALRERVEARFGQLSQGVTERGMTDKENFEYKHENDYDHQTFTPSQ